MNVSAQAGSTAYLNCRISLLQDKTVSGDTSTPHGVQPTIIHPALAIFILKFIKFYIANICSRSRLFLGWNGMLCVWLRFVCVAVVTRIWHLNFRVRACTWLDLGPWWPDAIFTVPELISTSLMTMTVACWRLRPSLHTQTHTRHTGTGVVGETRGEQR